MSAVCEPLVSVIYVNRNGNGNAQKWI